MSKGIPYGSRDVRHMPARTNTEDWWPFARGQVRTIGLQPLLAFQVMVIHDTWIEGIETLGKQIVGGELHIDLPVVIMKDAEGEPMVTLTLRRISGARAFIQVTANPKLRQGPRQ